MRDPIYKNIIKGTEHLYQKYFNEIINKIDVDNFTNQTLGRPVDKNKIEREYKIVEKIVKKAQTKNNLSLLVLQIMLEQYLWADIIMREIDKNKWIYRVMNRKREDYFPDSMAIYKNIFDNK